MMQLLPQSLFSRMVLILLGGLILVQSISVVFHFRERDRLLFRSISMESAQRISDTLRLLNSLAPADRHKFVATLNSPTLRISLDAPRSSLPRQNLDSANQAASFGMLLRDLLGEYPPITVTVSEMEWPERQHEVNSPHLASSIHPQKITAFAVETRLLDGSTVSFDALPTGPAFPMPPRPLFNLLILLAAVIVLSLLAVRLATRPLNTLASAAEKLGNDINSPPLLETGPTEVRRAAHAFNTMQSRLANYIQERTRILAAMSHDLKTPITRLRLRAELLEDDDLRAKFTKDLEEMESLVAATLDFMRGVDNPETVQPVDIMALLESLQADAAEIGHEVRLQGIVAQPYPCKPTALKRCLSNLIDNAIKYGKSATVIVNDGDKQLQIHILDHGQGIPEAELERVFEPFYRLENSRSRDTGGTGLGLGIARNIAQMHGGELVLKNQAGGGLEVILALPKSFPRGSMATKIGAASNIQAKKAKM
ncbi:putative two-component sensor histidine kinase [Sulfuricella denitrificans skB26]|uniref:histidine kinase n=1 Tax=Sulfuricella denitrificans (strain DSM 22764 / NBRC 105220 / skB26) TaxID=1163617 RepID=S6B3Q3_SULDS|nr:ATP-binding protein [Sulfuricella denitrificans]BAN35257.1 putative two-component sensor histidine kinase [Sulfuricella denitrificans skB26]